MRTLLISLQDITGVPAADGDVVWVSAPVRRPSGSRTLIPREEPVELVDGEGTIEVYPGPLLVRFDLAGVTFREGPTAQVVVPEGEGSISLTGLLSAAHDWSPEELSEFARLRDEAVSAAQDASGSADEAEGHAGQAGQDRSHVDQVRVLLDEAYDESQAGMALPPRLMESELNATYAAREFVGATGAAQLQGVTISPLATGDYVAVDVVDGVVFGSQLGSLGIGRSTDGETWTSLGMTPAGSVQRVFDSGDGAHIVVTDSVMYRVEGLLSGSPTYTAKFTVNGGARINKFNVSYDPISGRGIATEYGPGGPQFADSRYGHITLDHGQTWTQVWDSETLIPGDSPSDSHVHGCCYDPWEGVFYIVEGHGSQSGVWLSTDLGASWNLYDGYRVPSAPTCVEATDDGIVLTSDDAWAGLYGVPRVGPVEDRKIIRTVAWRATNAGVIGFGQHAQRDPDTGLVYAVYKSSYVDLRPVVMAGTATAGSIVYTYDGAPAATSDYQIRNVALLPGGKIAMFALKDGTTYERIIAWRPGKSIQTDDPAGIFGGYSGSGTSVATGPSASTGQVTWAVATGAGAEAAQQSVSIGYKAKTISARGVAIGDNSEAFGTLSVVAGSGSKSRGGQQTLIGADILGPTGGEGTGVGYRVALGTLATGVGPRASVLSTRGAGLGAGVVVAAAHLRSVALGSQTATTAADQVSIGPRHLAVEAQANEPSRPAAGQASYFTRINGSGKTEVCVKFRGPTAAGEVVVLATEGVVTP